MSTPNLISSDGSGHLEIFVIEVSIAVLLDKK